MTRGPPENPIVYICVMRKFVSYALAFVAAGATPVLAQDAATGACSTPATISVTGNVRLDTAVVRANSGLTTGSQLNVHDIQTAIKTLYALGQFDDVQIVCRPG